MKKKIVVSAIAIVLVLCCAIGGTLAWLTSTTETITNTFTVGNVHITLTEEEGTEIDGNPLNRGFKMIPGKTLAKDPKVTVAANSEACWLFVKVDEANNTLAGREPAEKYFNYEVRLGGNEWTALGAEYPGVYYRAVAASYEAQDFYVLTGTEQFANGAVTINSNITNADMDTANETAPTLTFTAYAIQQSGFDTPLKAWNEVSATAQG